MTVIFLCLKHRDKHIACWQDDLTRQISNFIKFQFTLDFFFLMLFLFLLPWIYLIWKKKKGCHLCAGTLWQNVCGSLIYNPQCRGSLSHSTTCSNVERIGSSLSQNTLNPSILWHDRLLKAWTLRGIYSPPDRQGLRRENGEVTTWECFSPTLCLLVLRFTARMTDFTLHCGPGSSLLCSVCTNF